MAETSLSLRFPECLKSEYPEEFDVCWQSTSQILELTKGRQLAPLGKRSPALVNFSWDGYLRLSTIRMVRVLSCLKKYAVENAAILDLGAYFGNFSLMARRAGYEVEAVDSYSQYENAFREINCVLENEGVKVIDFSSVDYSLKGLAAERFDCVLCMGVIEHVPHTPKPLMDAINHVLKRSGILILDTPNLAYLYNKQKLERGESIGCPIQFQYYTELPFEGHHREYTVAEIHWMLGQAGHQLLETQMFNYSIYGLSELQGMDLQNFERMAVNPEEREIILTVSRKS